MQNTSGWKIGPTTVSVLNSGTLDFSVSLNTNRSGTTRSKLFRRRALRARREALHCDKFTRRRIRWQREADGIAPSLALNAIARLVNRAHKLTHSATNVLEYRDVLVIEFSTARPLVDVLRLISRIGRDNVRIDFAETLVVARTAAMDFCALHRPALDDHRGCKFHHGSNGRTRCRQRQPGALCSLDCSSTSQVACFSTCE